MIFLLLRCHCDSYLFSYLEALENENIDFSSSAYAWEMKSFSREESIAKATVANDVKRFERFKKCPIPTKPRVFNEKKSFDVHPLDVHHFKLHFNSKPTANEIYCCTRNASRHVSFIYNPITKRTRVSPDT